MTELDVKNKCCATRTVKANDLLAPEKARSPAMHADKQASAAPLEQASAEPRKGCCYAGK